MFSDSALLCFVMLEWLNIVKAQLLSTGEWGKVPFCLSTLDSVGDLSLLFFQETNI